LACESKSFLADKPDRIKPGSRFVTKSTRLCVDLPCRRPTKRADIRRFIMNGWASRIMVLAAVWMGLVLPACEETRLQPLRRPKRRAQLLPPQPTLRASM
jgi:hypothetical protein